MWKNKHAGVSAKVPKRLKGKMTRSAKKGGEGADRGERDEKEESDGSDGSDGSEGSEGSNGSRGSGVAVDDEASERDTTLIGEVGSKASIDSEHGNETS